MFVPWNGYKYWTKCGAVQKSNCVTMCLSGRGKTIRLSVCFFFHYLADDILYWLQSYAQSLVWTTGIQQENSLVSSLWGLDGLCKPQETEGVLCDGQMKNHPFVRWVSVFGASCVWISVWAVDIPDGQVLNFNPESTGCSSLSMRPRERRRGEKMTGRLVWTCTGCTTLYGIKCSSWPEGTGTHEGTHTENWYYTDLVFLGNTMARSYVCSVCKGPALWNQSHGKRGPLPSPIVDVHMLFSKTTFREMGGMKQ